MSAARKPTALLELNGAFKKNPNRKRPQEPISAPFPTEPPEYLTHDQKQTWFEIVDHTPAGVLMKSDAFIVEMVAILLAEFRAAPSLMDNPRLTRLSVELGRLGLTPADRSKIIVPKNDEGDEFI